MYNVICSTNKYRETARRLTCHYHLYSQIVRLKKTNSKRIVFCFSAASGTTWRSAYSVLLQAIQICHESIVVQHSVDSDMWLNTHGMHCCFSTEAMVTPVFPNPWPRSSYLTVPPEENIYFLKLIYFLIISYLRDITVHCCWVSVYSLISDVKMNVI